MNKKILSFLATSLICIGANTAHAAPGYPVKNLNLRAGPDADYPLVGTLMRGENIDILGCIDGFSWCEVESAHRERGWVNASYLQTSYHNRKIDIVETRDLGILQTVIFSIDSYWDDNYSDRDFYAQRSRWEKTPPHHHDEPRGVEHRSVPAPQRYEPQRQGNNNNHGRHDTYPQNGHR